MPDIYIDADACPVKEDVFRVSKRYQLKVFVVSNMKMFLPKADWIIPVVVENRFDAVDDYIDETIKPNDICVTNDLLLSARILKREARVIDPKGKIYTDENIGEALATRELLSELRQYGDNHFGPKKKSKRDQSSFLSSFDQLINQALRNK